MLRNQTGPSVLEKGISVVVPVYNSAETLEELTRRLEAVLSEITDQFEILYINDASVDKSWEVVRDLSKSNSFIGGISLLRNYGQHNALLCGIRAARYDTIVTLDDDLQNPPEEIPVLIEHLNDGVDVVYGVPKKEQHGLFRDLASQITKRMFKVVMRVEVAQNIGAFRAFRTQIRSAFWDYQGIYPSIDVLLTWGTKRFHAVPVDHFPREKGVSNYNSLKLALHAINMITGFSTLPLRIGSFLGFSFMLFGFVLFLYVISRYLLHGTPVAGFPFLASIITIFSGVQLFVLGIYGEYLARMHLRLQDRPTYTVFQEILPERKCPSEESGE